MTEANRLDAASTERIELVVISLTQATVRCRVLAAGRPVTIRGWWEGHVAPGEIVTVRPRGEWREARVFSAALESTRLAPAELGLVPLRLEGRGDWNPKKEYWREPGSRIEPWEREIIARGTRPAWEMEQVLPGLTRSFDPMEKFENLCSADQGPSAWKLLMGLCHADLRCLDAHAHLGFMVFDWPHEAIRYYAAGVGIGELSLGEGFDDVLPWGCIDNRPFLRCLHGYGLCLWRLGRMEEAEAVFRRMLRLNPTDNQGARCLIDDLRQKIAWEQSSARG